MKEIENNDTREDIKKLKALGVSAERNKELYQFSQPRKEVLEFFDNKYPENESVITFHSDEGLSSLCPLTGQPDSCRHLWIQYVPNQKLLESKSLKLYINGYRNFGCFHEEICHRILNDIFSLLDPFWVRVVADYAPRGGYSIAPAVERTAKGYQMKISPPSIQFSKNFN